RQDSLKAAVASLLGRTAGGVAFYQVEFALGGVFLGAVSQLAGKRAGLQSALADDEVAGFTSGLTGTGGSDAFFQYLLGVIGVLFQVKREAFVNGTFHQTLHFDVAQFAFGLSFELRLGEFNADNGGEPFAGIFAGQVRVVF